MNKKKQPVEYAIILAFGIFVLISFVISFNPGKQIAHNFYSFFIAMIKILPCVSLEKESVKLLLLELLSNILDTLE